MSIDKRLIDYPNLAKEFNIDLNSVSPESIRKSERIILRIIHCYWKNGILKIYGSGNDKFEMLL